MKLSTTITKNSLGGRSPSAFFVETNQTIVSGLYDAPTEDQRGDLPDEGFKAVTIDHNCKDTIYQLSVSFQFCHAQGDYVKPLYNTYKACYSASRSIAEDPSKIQYTMTMKNTWIDENTGNTLTTISHDDEWIMFDNNTKFYVSAHGSGVLNILYILSEIFKEEYTEGKISTDAIGYDGQSFTLSFPNHEAQYELLSKLQELGDSDFGQ